jgi:hypothetical protein
VSAYIERAGAASIVVNADDSTDRRSRGAQAAAVKRAYERAQPGVRLSRASSSYSETPGFLARTSITYRVTGVTRSRGAR